MKENEKKERPPKCLYCHIPMKKNETYGGVLMCPNCGGQEKLPESEES